MLHSLRRLQSLVYLLTGRPVFDAGYYREAEWSRLANLFAHVDLEEWRGMRILEVGAGLGRLGQAFRRVGFEVISSDGRPEHVRRMQERGIPAVVLDLDSGDIGELGEFDIILAFGVLYHLSEPEKFLRSCGERARVLLLETVVLDRPEPLVERVAEARGLRSQDQAVSSHGCRPTPSWVESTCREAGFDRVRDISTALANWPIGRYDWQPRGDGAWRRDGFNYRKMWVCEKSRTNESADGIERE